MKRASRATRDKNEKHGAGRKAVGVDAELKEANQNRLRRIEGQIRGLQKMVEEDRYCADVIVQIASVQQALRGVARNLMKNHMRHCAAEAMGNGKREEKEVMYEELLGLMELQQR
jgi:CsoR family transcriptional regulator, copper-sensing transcriptional repressor